jgi:hypothetical protein
MDSTPRVMAILVMAIPAMAILAMVIPAMVMAIPAMAILAMAMASPATAMVIRPKVPVLAETRVPARPKPAQLRQAAAARLPRRGPEYRRVEW